MEKAVARLNSSLNQNTLPSMSDIGGEFPITDLKTNLAGTLEICMEGIGLKFEAEQQPAEFIELKRVKKCTTQKDDTFVLEEFGNLIFIERKAHSGYRIYKFCEFCD
jgi:hypothetical protein